MSAPAASVIVTTRNRAAWLADCLRSLLEDRSSTPREILVVDNASTDSTAAVVASFASARLPVRYVLEPRLGQSNARNAGVREARGEILLFTDDDVLVGDGWVDAVVEAFRDPDVAAAGGRILPDWEEPPPPWLDGPHAELLTLRDHGAEPRLFGPAEHPVGANMALRRAAIAGFRPPFDPRLGHRGARRLANEEHHLLSLLGRDGVVAYVPAAVVYHRVPKERVSLEYLRRGFFEHGIGLARRLRIEGGPLPSLPRRLVRGVRAYRKAAATRRTNERLPRLGSTTWEELYGVVWVGYYLELLVGARSERLGRWVVGHGA